jgi:hypothetical protein
MQAKLLLPCRPRLLLLLLLLVKTLSKAVALLRQRCLAKQSDSFGTT